MGLVQFANSVASIHRASHVGSARGIARHLMWQLRKLTNGFPTSLRISDSRLHVDYPGGVAALVNSLGVYDYNNMNLIKLLLRRSCGVFFDVGANVGSYTLVASEAPGTVVSFEPHPKAFAALGRNIELNGRSNVITVNKAVAGCRGRVLFTDGPQLAVNHVVETTERDDNTIQVEATTLDETIRQLSLRPNVVKIDVEGYEAKVLDGFREGIRTVEVVLIEAGQRDEIRRHPNLRQFVGPCYFHFDSHTFSPRNQRRKEDPIFVRSDAIGKLEACGLSWKL